MQDWKRVETKIDGLVEDVGSLKITAAEQHVVLKEHIRRTELLEEEIRPIKKHVHMVDGALKLLGILSLLFGIWRYIS